MVPGPLDSLESAPRAAFALLLHEDRWELFWGVWGRDEGFGVPYLEVQWN